MSWPLAGIALQIPDANNYDNAWKYLVVVLLFFGVPAIVYLFKENGKLNAKLQTDIEKQRDDWKLQSQTCSADFGKTSEALKVANDSTVIVVGKVDKLAAMQEKLSGQLDRNAEQLRTCSDTMTRLQPVMDRIQIRFARDEP